MTTVSDILSRYDSLVKYCDKFWNMVVQKHPELIHCKKGCCQCCELESVTAIETFIIYNHLRIQNNNYAYNDNSNCVFLYNSTCTIYNCRPVICRTHGLLLSNSETPVIYTCPLNCELDTKIDEALILDWETITVNLIKLNLAFCITTGIDSYASERFLLKDIVSGLIPRKLQIIGQL